MAPLPKHDYATVVADALNHDSIASLARAHGIKPNTLVAYFRANPDAAVGINGGLAEWEDTDVNDVRRLLRERGLSEHEWLVTRARVNEWGAGVCKACDAPVEPLRQTRVDLEPTSNVVLPARADGWKPPKRKPRKPGVGELVAVLSDQHAPHHDPVLHEVVCAWLTETNPDRVIVLGDLLDLDGVSRHRHNPEWASTMQESVDQGYKILRDYVGATPASTFQMLAGNHEDRLRNALLDNLRAVTGLTRPGDEHGVLTIPFLLRLDELGVEWVGAQGEYSHYAVRVSHGLSARHGWIAAKGAGASALKTLDALRHNVIVGHTHRQGIVQHTHHTIDGDPVILSACEAGTLARIRGGLGYVPVPDWQQGFATAQVYEDGGITFDLARWDGVSLSWRGRRWAA